jgi:16S rRNA (guanine527-N7)-methyltransferase
VTNSENLIAALTRHELSVPDAQREQLQQYCEQLWDWNTRFNITRHTDFEAFVSRDLNDSLQLAKHLQSGESILDAGAGGGVPGIVLAILNSSLSVSLAESTQKKATALQAIVSELNLPVTVFAERAEDVIGRHPVDTITARAVAPLKKLIPWFQPQRRRVKRLLLVKGRSWPTECDEAEEAGLLRRVELNVLSEYTTSGRDGKDVIAEVRFGPGA